MNTVKIVDNNKENKRGWKIINESDLEKSDVLFSEEKPAQEVTKPKGKRGASNA